LPTEGRKLGVVEQETKIASAPRTSPVAFDKDRIMAEKADVDLLAIIKAIAKDDGGEIASRLVKADSEGWDD
jgi:hypothetical protein